MSFFFFKQKTAYEMRISDWSSDVCSSDLTAPHRQGPAWILSILWFSACTSMRGIKVFDINVAVAGDRGRSSTGSQISSTRSEEHTSELQTLMRNSYAVFCLQKKKSSFTNLCTSTAIECNNFHSCQL